MLDLPIGAASTLSSGRHRAMCDRPLQKALCRPTKGLWSGRRESNPRMQLGKLDVSQLVQDVSCKTFNFRPQYNQTVTPETQNSQLLASLVARVPVVPPQLSASPNIITKAKEMQFSTGADRPPSFGQPSALDVGARRSRCHPCPWRTDRSMRRSLSIAPVAPAMGR